MNRREPSESEFEAKDDDTDSAAEVHRDLNDALVDLGKALDRVEGTKPQIDWPGVVDSGLASRGSSSPQKRKRSQHGHTSRGFESPSDMRADRPRFLNGLLRKMVRALRRGE